MKYFRPTTKLLTFDDFSYCSYSWIKVNAIICSLYHYKSMLDSKTFLNGDWLAEGDSDAVFQVSP